MQRADRAVLCGEEDPEDGRYVGSLRETLKHQDPS